MAPTIGAVSKKKEEGQTGNVNMADHLRDGVSGSKMNRSASNTSILGQSKMMNQSQM
jgi:hypothetical protein